MKPELLIKLICEIAKTHEVSQEKIKEMIIDSIIKTFNKQLPDCILNIELNLETGSMISEKVLVVVDDAPEGAYDDFVEITLSDSKKYGNYNIGDKCNINFDINDPKNFTKTQVLQTMQIFKQKLNEINNIKIFQEWSPRVGELIFAEIEKYDSRGGFYTVSLDDGKNFGFLSKKESIPTEDLKPGNKYKFLIKEVKEQSKGWPIILSRADAGFVMKLLEIEIPEIQSGEIEVNAIERLAGFKTKIAVSSHNTSYDATAVCVGSKGSRIKTISEQLMNERIEIIKFNENKKEFLIIACGPKNIVGLKYNEPKTEDELPHATLIVNDDALPIIIGRKGFNIKLISKLVGCSIDINTIEQANDSKLEYEVINQMNYINERTPRKFNNNDNRFNNNFSNENNYVTKKRNIISNDDLLSEIENLSSDELKDLYDVNITKTNHSNFDNSLNISDEEEFIESSNNLNSSLMDELENAFGDEIANILENDKK